MTDDRIPEYIGQAILTSRLEVCSGLHIGAGKDTIEIGGIDNPVVKTPAGDPYIPGSSLKGKLRFLLEWAFGKVTANGKPWDGGQNNYDPDDPILRIFGTPAKKEDWAAGPTRLLMRDAMLDPEWRVKTLNAGRELTEAKTEVTIDRIAGKAAHNIGARQMERVPPGAGFNFEAAFRLYAVDDDKGQRDRECLAWLIQGLDLLEQDALGGSGSRGYGRVKFRELKLKGPSGDDVRLDGNKFMFRDHLFSKASPSELILKAVEQALGGS